MTGLNKDGEKGYVCLEDLPTVRAQTKNDIVTDLNGIDGFKFKYECSARALLSSVMAASTVILAASY